MPWFDSGTPTDPIAYWFESGILKLEHSSISFFFNQSCVVVFYFEEQVIVV